MSVKKIIEQASHRNGVGGHPAVISLFEAADEDGLFVATSLTPNMTDALTPSAFAIERYGVEDAYVRQWVSVFAVDTVVLNVEQTAARNIAFARGNSWRGADNYGPALAQAWREKCLAEAPSYDPALEWYHEERPEEV